MATRKEKERMLEKLLRDKEKPRKKSKKQTEPTSKIFGYRISDKFSSILQELSDELGIAKNQVLNQALLRFYQEYKKI